MKIAKIMLGIVFVGVLGAIGFFFMNDTNKNINNNEDNNFTKIEGGRRGDDPVYAEEIKKNTALTIATRDEQKKLSEQLSSALSSIKEQGRKQEVAAKQRVKELEYTIKQLKKSAQESTGDQAAQKVQEELSKKLNEITSTMTLLKKSLDETATNSTNAINDIRSQIEAGIAISEPSEEPKLDIDIAPKVTETSEVTYPYGYKAAQRTNIDTNNDTEKTDLNVIDFLSNKISGAAANVSEETTNERFSDGEAIQTNGNLPVAKKKQEEWETVFPVYTLPPNTVLSSSTLITPIIGRVPLNGDVKDPFFFKVEIGGENLAANGHTIPGVEKMIASGYSTGIREQSCARGYIDSITFVFVDGRIVTQGKATGNGKNSNGKIGYLADQWGKPCIRGKYINNAKDYLMSRGGAAFIEAAAAGLSQSQVSYKQGEDGSTQAILDGNVWKYIFGQGVGGAAGEIADYVRERVSGAFDVVYVEQNRKVQIFLDQMVPIDYDSNARKINYYDEPED